jgi:hypothetical protein
VWRTHVPGLFYIVALNAIISEGPSFASGVLQVLLFNAIWFAAAIAARNLPAPSGRCAEGP